MPTPGLDVAEAFRRTGAAVSQVSNGRQVPAVYNQFFFLGGAGMLAPLPHVPRRTMPKRLNRFLTVLWNPVRQPGL